MRVQLLSAGATVPRHCSPFAPGSRTLTDHEALGGRWVALGKEAIPYSEGRCGPNTQQEGQPGTWW